MKVKIGKNLMETQKTRYDQIESKLILKKKDHVSTNKSEKKHSVSLVIW